MFQFPRFPSVNGWRGVTPDGFPHSDIQDSCGYTHLILAFRSVSRLSSAFDTKAFTIRPLSLLQNISSPAGDTEMLTLSLSFLYYFISKPQKLKSYRVLISILLFFFFFALVILIIHLLSCTSVQNRLGLICRPYLLANSHSQTHIDDLSHPILKLHSQQKNPTILPSLTWHHALIVANCYSALRTPTALVKWPLFIQSLICGLDTISQLAIYCQDYVINWLVL